MRLLWLGQKQKKSLTNNNKFWKEIHFPYQKGLFLLPRASDWPNTLPTPAGAGHQRMIPTNMGALLELF